MEVGGKNDSYKAVECKMNARSVEKCDMEGSVSQNGIHSNESQNTLSEMCASNGNSSNYSQKSTPDQQEEWVDITDEFKRATGKLGLGELFHEKMFTLFEAMSAIEMMDPKMDAGMVCNKKEHFTIEEAVSKGLLKVDQISHRLQIDIFDASLRCLASWLEGHSLAQTCFTNMYLHKPDLIPDRTLRVTSIAHLKLIAVIRDIVCRMVVFEEEDFQIVYHNFSLAADVQDAKACSMLKEVEDDLMKTSKELRDKQDGDTGSLEKEIDLLTNLHSRVRFWRFLLQSMQTINKKKTSGIDEAKKMIQVCLGLLPSIKSSSSDSMNQEDFPSVPGFDSTVNQRLLPSTFPRSTKIVSFQRACDMLNDMLLRIVDATEVLHASTFDSALLFFSEFSKRNPCVLSRSICQLLYVPTPCYVHGVTQTTDVLKDSIRTFCKPPMLLAKTLISQRPDCKEYTEALIAHCVQPMFGLLQLSGHNRARQREKMARLLEEFAIIQEKAKRVDNTTMAVERELEPTMPLIQWFSIWLMNYVLRIEINYLLAGFELELYSVHEYEYIFWYLHEYLYRFLITVLQQADTYMMDCDKRQRKLDKKVKKLKYPKHYHSKDICLYQVMQNICGGYYKTMVALKRDGRIKSPQCKYDTERVRFEHRFSAFATVSTPPVVSYAQYEEATDLTSYSGDLFAAASKCFLQAKLLMESNNDLCCDQATLLRITKNNTIVVNLLQSGHKTDAKVDFDFSSHMHFPLIKLS